MKTPTSEPADGHFDTEHLRKDLTGRSVRGGAATLTNQACQFALRLGSTMVLARILAPEDFGLLAMVTAVTGVVATFQDMGLSTATIQREEVNHQQVSTLFWINVALSTALCALVAALAPLVAWFYHEPRLTLMTIVLASAFLFSGVAIQHRALLSRQMRFGVLAVTEVIGLAIGVATAIIAARCGAGYWALVLMQLATTFATTLGIWIACGWRPGLPARRSGVRPLLAFGGHLTGYHVVRYCVQNLDKMLIGRYYGALSLGLYSKAYQLLLLPIRQVNVPITTVAIPALSRLQDDPPRYRNHYLQAVKLIAFLTMPLIAAMLVLSREVIELVLGPQWGGATRIYLVLGLAAFMQPVANTSGWVLITLDQTRRMAIWGLIALPLMALSFVVGLPWGPIGVATSYVIYIYAIRYPTFAYSFKHSPVTVGDLLVVIYRPALLSVGMGLAMYGGRAVMADMNAVWTALATLGVGAIVLAVLLLAWGGARSDVHEIVGLARRFRTAPATTADGEAPDTSA